MVVGDTNDGDDDDNLQIPELPVGRTLEIQLLDGCGGKDQERLGLLAVEMFGAEKGERPSIEEISHNGVEEGRGRVESLFVPCFENDEGFSCRGNAHHNSPPKIVVKLGERTTIAMMRIWNLASPQSTRKIRIALDGTTIFKGELEEQNETTILFTVDEQILESIAQHDDCLVPVSSQTSVDLPFDLPARPATAVLTENGAIVENGSHDDARDSDEDETEACLVRVLQLELLSNWGCSDAIGLDGIEAISRTGIPIAPSAITASRGNDTVERLLNGRNITRDADEQWLVDWRSQTDGPVIVTLTFSPPVELIGVGVWNYNASHESAYAGARHVNIIANGSQNLATCVLRKAPGSVFYDHVQDVLWKRTRQEIHSTLQRRPSTKSLAGFVFQIHVLSTWGDEFYVGLNGLQLLGPDGEEISLKAHHVAAFPESLHVLAGHELDARRSLNLINGKNDTDDPAAGWLTPWMANAGGARVFVVFNSPRCVSRMNLWNYRRTPTRGARHLAISVDDLIVYSGEMQMGGRLSVSMREQ